LEGEQELMKIFNKLYFNILDFRNATDLFADENFDGDPIRVKPVSEDTDLTDIVDEEEENDVPIIDEESGEEILIDPPEPEPPLPPQPPPPPRRKVYVNGIDVSVLISRELYFDQHGKPITISLKDHSKEIIKGQFATLDDFLNSWNSADKKEAIIKELEEQGVLVDALKNAVNRDVDIFDLICHVAYDQPPMTRKERANNVKKRNYFTKYGEQARKVLEALLEKYTDEGVTNIENMEVLRVQPFTEYGSPVEIIKQFGSKAKYLEAIKELELELYKTGA
jgi:type I restriction enzyme, R subunit